MSGQYTEVEMSIAREYKRVTGSEPIGLIDTLRTFTVSEKLFDLVLDYLLEKDAERE